MLRLLWIRQVAAANSTKGRRRQRTTRRPRARRRVLVQPPRPLLTPSLAGSHPGSLRAPPQGDWNPLENERKTESKMDSSKAASTAGGANRFGAEGTGGDGGTACSKTSYSPPYTPSARDPPPCRRPHCAWQTVPDSLCALPARSGHTPLAQEAGQEALARLAALQPRPPLPAPPAQHLHRLSRGCRHGRRRRSRTPLRVPAACVGGSACDAAIAASAAVAPL